MKETSTYDILAIGGGTAGLVTAAGAAGLGARAALVERDRLGGDCLWTGCVPSKALIASARAADAFRRADRFGLERSEPRPDGARVLESVRAVRARIQPHDDPERFRAMGVDVRHGTARFVSPHEVEVEGEDGVARLRARRFVIATGSRAAVPPIPGLEETGYFTHETAFDREDIPASLVVIGAGPIGVELAQSYRRLGTEVTLVEMEDRILPLEDADPARGLQAILEEEGIRVLTGVRATGAERRDGRARLRLEVADGRAPDEAPAHVAAAEFLVAAGRRPNVEGLGLEAAGVETDSSGVRVDAKLRTSQRHIFAAGDVSGGLMFTHVADHEARAVLRNALFPFPSSVSYEGVPWCTYTDPELARVGLTEAEARERLGEAARAWTFDLGELDRAITEREARGLVKLVADGRGRVVGGHILAPGAGTMIAEVAMAVKHGIKLGEISALVHPYPTMSEAVRKAGDAYMRARLTERSSRWLERWFSLARRLRL